MSVDERRVAAEDVSFLSFVMFHFVFSPPLFLFPSGSSFRSWGQILFRVTLPVQQLGITNMTLRVPHTHTHTHTHIQLLLAFLLL